MFSGGWDLGFPLIRGIFFRLLGFYITETDAGVNSETPKYVHAIVALLHNYYYVHPCRLDIAQHNESLTLESE